MRRRTAFRPCVMWLQWWLVLWTTVFVLSLLLEPCNAFHPPVSSSSLYPRSSSNTRGGAGPAPSSLRLFSSFSDPNWITGSQNSKEEEEQRTRDALIRAALELNGAPNDKLERVHLVGVANLPTNSRSFFSLGTNNTLPCAVLSRKPSLAMKHTADTEITDNNNNVAEAPQPCLLLPLSPNSNRQLTLLRSAVARDSISKALLLQWNLLAVNRDDGLFDNLPYAAWTIDPYRTGAWKDAAGNPVLEKFHMGKRDAYNRLLGKDWIFDVQVQPAPQKKSTSQPENQKSSSGYYFSSLLSRVSQLLQPDSSSNDDDNDDSSSEEQRQQQEQRASLEGRILDLRIRELEMDMAEWEYQLAIARTTKNMSEEEQYGESARSTEQLEASRQETADELEALRQERIRWQQQQQQETKQSQKDDDDVDGLSAFEYVLKKGLNEMLKSQYANKQPAPYPGATGYAPLILSEDEDEDASKDSLQSSPKTDGGNKDDGDAPVYYTNPYDMFREILRTQMKAQVIGAVLENTSLLQGTSTLGGALVLRRMTASKKLDLLGETLQVQDDEETFGNDGITGGTTFVVECHADEAVGMSLACNVPLQVEQFLWQRGSVMAQQKPMAQQTARYGNSSSFLATLPAWETVDPELSVIMEGEAGNLSATERVLPIRIPRTATNLFDEITSSPPPGAAASSSSSGMMFPTDNPIQSLQAYDELDNDAKARTLLGMSNFNGRLPRPRALRRTTEETSDDNNNALDDLLLPLIDESVRNQYLLRQARQRGDLQRVAELEQSKTRRQVAKEKAAQARESGSDDVADWWDNEAEFLASLRADPTQDEGSYSRFLDRDEWYERQRRNQAKKLDRKKFGTLLDGIE